MNTTTNQSNNPFGLGYIPPEESLIEYPCDFPIKVMAIAHPDLVTQIVVTTQTLDPAFTVERLQQRPSRNGKYVGLTVTVTATSREQLDALYQRLHDHPLVKMLL